jgi:uroporphyrinogen decarboxylase
MRVPIVHPKPDVEEFLSVVLGRRPVGKRPPLVEYIIDDAVSRPILEAMGRRWVPLAVEPSAYWDNYVEFWYRMGYDFVRYEVSLPFRETKRQGQDPTVLGGRRSWAETGRGPIGSWDEFERYPWPEVEDGLFQPFEEISRRLPEGMGFIACHGAGILEHVRDLMGYETLCLCLYDDPGLVEAVCEAVGSRIEQFYRKLLQFDRLVAVFQGDDMGHRTGTLIHPDHLRHYFLPWHKRFASRAHERGIPYFLHSCGNILAVMEDLIEVVGIDGKHSFEDAILPAAEFHARYHQRIATLGGVDVNVLARGTEEEVRGVVRGLVERCAPLGRFAIGSGNSIPSYVPPENYLAMLDEVLSL